MDATVEKVILTHAHLDHCAASDVLRQQLEVPIEGPHRGDAFWLEGLPEATLIVDYNKGTLKLNAKKHELGDYAKGNVATLLDVIVGALRWRDVPVLHSTGKRASY